MSHLTENIAMSQTQWDQWYRMGTPPWDSGKPSLELMRIVQEQPIRACPTLELGCGTGANAIWLAKRRYDVTAIDWSPLAIERARLRTEQHDALLRLVCADVFEFARNGGRFDFVYDAGLYHFIRQAELSRFLDLLWWVTQPGSYYLTLAGNAEEASEEQGPPRVSEEDLRGELGRLFEVVSLRPCRIESALRPEGFLGWSCLMRRPPLAE
jgi:SAM-dependent methyltransferase